MRQRTNYKNSSINSVITNIQRTMRNTCHIVNGVVNKIQKTIRTETCTNLNEVQKKGGKNELPLS